MKSFFLFFLLLPFWASGQGQLSADTKTIEQKLAYFLRLTDTLRQQTHNPGLAIAIIWNGKVLYQGGWATGT